MNERKRIEWVDVVKGIVMILVIISHTEEHFMPGQMVTLKIPIYSFHMPLFFFVSGYLFSMKGNFKEFVKGKCKRILVPYFCLGTLLVLFDTFWQGRNAFGNPWFQPQRFLGGMFNLIFQCRFWTLWFIACLFWLNIIFYIIVSRTDTERKRVMIVTIMAVAGCVYFLFGGWSLPWNIDVCFTTMPFFYVGYRCRKSDFVNQKILGNKHKWLMFVGFILLDAVCTIINFKVTGQYLELWGNMYGIAPLVYIAAFAGIFAVIILADACRGFAPFKYIGINTMLFYAWHQTMLLPLIEHFYVKMMWFQDAWLPPVMYYGRVFLTTLIICVVMTILNEIICRAKLGFMVGK